MTLLSIVSGTYNRLPYLMLMILSARQQLPKGIAYEFIIIDGGSTDGTLDWLRQQPDVRLIEDGRLTGAIDAFCRGAEASDAEYVLMANDDIVFHPYSILAALAHLETHASCAAVAFADNRTSLVTGHGHDYRTEGIGCTLPDGSRSMVTYAQVGLFRRALGHEAGWWGWRDPVMKRAKTYGGDSFLSARLWEMGYTVDPVAGAGVDDLIVRDALRNEHAVNLNGSDSAAYYERFPTVHIPFERAIYPLTERLRILFLPIYEPTYPQAANREAWLTEAFGAYGTCLEVDYLNTKVNLPALVKAWQPDLLITQAQGWGERLTPQMLADARRACPGMVIVNWNGDAHEHGLTDRAVLDLLEHVDLQTTVNAKVLPFYAARGIAAAYWQIAYRDPLDPLPAVPAWDVLFAGNWYDYRTPLFRLLYQLRYRLRVGIYGNDAQADGNSHYDFALQAALYQQARIVVGDTFPNTEGFVSNRLFQVLSQGGFLLQQASYNLSKWTGLIPGVHYVEWTDLADLEAKIDEWMRSDHDAARQTIIEAGRAFVRANFSPQAQVRKLFEELLPAALIHEPQPELWADGIPR